MPPAQLVAEVRQALQQGPRPDVITLAGSGEPTLYEPLGELILALKDLTAIPVVLLTNGALFWKAEVRRDAVLADIIIPSLDAGDEATFQRINRPQADLSLEQVVQGLEALRKEFTGPLWLEVMLVSGLNDQEAQVRDLAREAHRIRPDRIQLNTPVRPSALGPEAIVAPDRLQAWCPWFTPRAEVIADFKGLPAPSATAVPPLAERLLDLLARRPCTVEDASQGLSVAPNEVVKALAALQARGRIQLKLQGDQTYYAAPTEGGAPWV